MAVKKEQLIDTNVSKSVLRPAYAGLWHCPQLLPNTFTGRAGCYVDWQQMLKHRMCNVYIFSLF